MKTEDLNTLSVLFRTKNLTQAAAQLYISQPALTVRLQNIERELDCKVAARSNKGVVFTPEGEYLAKRAAEISALMEQTLRHVRSMQSEYLGTIRLLAPFSFSRYFLLDILRDYKAVSPGTSFQIEVADSSEIVKRVGMLGAHCGFVHGDYLDTLPKLWVASMPAYVVSRTPLTVEQMPELPFITHNTSEKTHEIIREWWQGRFGSDLEPQMSVKNIDLCLHMVEAGMGIGIVFGDFWDKDYKICKLPLHWSDHRPLTRSLWFLYASEVMESPCMCGFLSFLRERAPLIPSSADRLDLDGEAGFFSGSSWRKRTK